MVVEADADRYDRDTDLEVSALIMVVSTCKFPYNGHSQDLCC